jgi:hypothetical protein
VFGTPSQAQQPVKQRTLAEPTFQTTTTQTIKRLSPLAIKSAGRAGSAAFTVIPTNPQKPLPDVDLDHAAQRHLPAHRCHRRQCGARCDVYGHHALTCTRGGHLVK